MEKRIKRINIIFSIAGFLLFFLLLSQVNLRIVFKSILRIGWKVFIVFFIAGFWHVFHALGWYFIIKANNYKIGYSFLLKTVIAGFAINQLTPMVNIGGEPYRAYMISKHISKSEALATIIIDNIIFHMSTVLFIIIGIFFSILLLPLSKEVRGVLYIALAIIVILFELLRLQHKKGILSDILTLAKRLHIKIKRFDEKMQKAIDIDTKISDFYHNKQTFFLLSLFSHLFARVFYIFEMQLILYFINAPSYSFLVCLFILTGSSVINNAFFFVPYQVGVNEVNLYYLFHLLSINKYFSIPLALIKRIRDFFWIGIGLLIMLRYGMKKVEE